MTSLSIVGCDAAVDVVFALDASSSLGAENFQKELNLVFDIISGLRISSQARVGLLTYASEVQVVFNLNTYSSTIDVLNAASVYYTGGSTNTAAAIDTTNNIMFTSQNGDRPGVRNILVLLSDGQASDRRAALEAAMKVTSGDNHESCLVELRL